MAHTSSMPLFLLFVVLPALAMFLRLLRWRPKSIDSLRLQRL
jgi:hypothetical protein